MRLTTAPQRAGTIREMVSEAIGAQRSPGYGPYLAEKNYDISGGRFGLSVSTVSSILTFSMNSMDSMEAGVARNRRKLHHRIRPLQISRLLHQIHPQVIGLFSATTLSVSGVASRSILSILFVSMNSMEGRKNRIVLRLS